MCRAPTVCPRDRAWSRLFPNCSRSSGLWGRHREGQVLGWSGAGRARKVCRGAVNWKWQRKKREPHRHAWAGTLRKTHTKDGAETENTGSEVPVLWYNLSSTPCSVTFTSLSLLFGTLGIITQWEPPQGLLEYQIKQTVLNNCEF